MKIPKEIKDKEGMGNTKGRKCSITGCENISVRSLSEDEYENYVLRANLKYVENRLRKIYVCNKHFKMVKKKKDKNDIHHKKGFLENNSQYRRNRF